MVGQSSGCREEALLLAARLLDCPLSATNIPMIQTFNTWARTVAVCVAIAPSFCYNGLELSQGQWRAGPASVKANGRFCASRRTTRFQEERAVGLFARIWRVIKGW